MGYCPDEIHMEEEDRSKAVLKSSAESEVDDGQVEQEDIAPEEEDAADQEEMLRPPGRIGRARGRKKFLERVPPVVTMRLIMTCFCLRKYFSGCQNLSFWIDASGLLNRMLGLICRPDGFAGWMPPQVTTSNHIQMYHRRTRRMNFSQKQTHKQFKKTENKRLGRSPRGT